MASPRSLLARVARLEHARRPKLSRIARAYGSFESFEAQVRQEVEARALNRTDWLGQTDDGYGGVLGALRSWEREGLI